MQIQSYCYIQRCSPAAAFSGNKDNDCFRMKGWIFCCNGSSDKTGKMLAGYQP